MGFLDEFDDKKTLEVYALGTPVFKISFDDYICLGSRCMTKKAFVDTYISDELYDNIMNDILSRKKLLLAGEYKNTKDGFVQSAKMNGKYDIEYVVTSRSVEFVEKIHGFRFLMRSIDGE